MSDRTATRQQGRRYSGQDAAERTRQRRTALLAAALELFAQQGYPSTSVKQICRQAGLTERYFYESFRDRHACLVALYTELAEQMQVATTAAIADAEDRPDEEIVRSALGAFVDYLTADSRRARVVLLEVVGASAELEQRRHAVLRDFAELTTAVWSQLAERTGPTDAQRLAAIGLVGAVNHLLVDWLHRGQRETPAELVDTCSTLFTAVRNHLES